jgi:Bacterial transglutaminase-like cysteine proteinase BTLCP
MIAIIAVLCSLSSPANCHEQTVTTSDFADVSMQSCLMGTPQLAEWMNQWSDPLETLHSNSGDCEDYAIVKYAALLAAGVSKDAVKIVVLRNQLPNEDHAVVAVRVDNQWLILDNRTLTLVRDMDVRRAIPEFVLDDQGVSRFVWSSRNWKVSGPLPVTDARI